MSRRKQVEVHVSDRAVARVAGYVTRSTDGVAGLRPALSGRVQSLVRGQTDGELAAVAVRHDADAATVTVQVAVRLDPPPVQTVEQVASRVRAELLRLTGAEVAVEVVITAVE